MWVSRQRSKHDDLCYRWSSTDAASGPPVDRKRRKFPAPFMASMKAGLEPGKGTQVVLLRHGMSTFNKLNIFTVSFMRKLRIQHTIFSYDHGYVATVT